MEESWNLRNSRHPWRVKSLRGPGEHIPQAPVINQLINQRATKGTSHSPKHSNERIKCVDQTQRNRAHVINPYWLKTHKLNNDIELSFNKPETAQQIEWIKSHSPLLLQREFLDSVLQIMLLTVKQFSVSMHWCPQSIFYKPQFCEWPPEHLTQKILNAVCTLGRAHRSSTFRGEGSWVTEQHNSTNWTSSSWSSVGLQCSCVRLRQASFFRGRFLHVRYTVYDQVVNNEKKHKRFTACEDTIRIHLRLFLFLLLSFILA